ncbi:MAG: helix-turn-helix domain-containing protein [Colwellia sp.]|nr:helix-turn-helix domain-containing protein [Colwellia sp.]
MLEKMYSIKQLMAMYDCSESTIKAWYKRGLVKTKIGKLARVTEKDLEEFIASGKA